MQSTEQTTESPSILEHEFLKNLNLGSYAIKRLQEAYDSIVEADENINYEFQFESLWNFMEDQDREAILLKIGELKELLNPNEELERWDPKAKELLDEIGDMLAKKFDFTEGGEELGKGTTYENLVGFWERYRDPKNNQKPRLDCKLATTMLWYILDREEVRLPTYVRYLNRDFFTIPNWSAHPGLWLPVADYVDPSIDDDWSKTGGLMLDFIVAHGKGVSRVGMVKSLQDIDPYIIRHVRSLDNLIDIYDLFFFTALLVQKIVNQKDLLKKPTTKEITGFVVELLGKRFNHETLYRLDLYVDHLLKL